jgi:CBS domain containing-hemolysin-like protein
MLLLVIIVLSALAVSALCSVLEACLLSVRVVSLTERSDQGDKSAARMLELKQNHMESSIGAILTYNTIAHTIGAALSGAQAARVFGDAWVGVFSAVLTVLILIATEIIPKTVGTVYADRLVGFVGMVITIMIKPPMRWILFVTHALTRLFVRGEKRKISRGEVLATVKMAARDGSLAETESMVVANLLTLRQITVDDILTPRTVMVTFQQDLSVSDALNVKDARHFSRIPIYGEDVDDVTGYVLMRVLLRAAADGDDLERPVLDHLLPLPVVEDTKAVGDALSDFTTSGDHLAVVIDPLGVVSGLVTMEDLIETALGVEIVDEKDKVADLRQQAIELRDQRLARMRKRRNQKSKLHQS